jgi:hypothetical protein
MREYQVLICERLGVKFPGSTRHSTPNNLGTKYLLPEVKYILVRRLCSVSVCLISFLAPAANAATIASCSANELSCSCGCGTVRCARSAATRPDAFLNALTR